MKRIGIIGASGYIGKHLIGTFASRYAVTALQRNVHAMMPEANNISIISIDDTDQTFDIIINTSYNLSNDIQKVFEQNETVLKTIQRVSHPDTKIIHLSSLAVFGFGLDKPIEATPQPLKNDYVYVMSKVHMENCLFHSIPHGQLSIIRLGNVWGPANNSWTQPVADALQWGLPVYPPASGYSNITYIHHICDYIEYLIDHSEHQVFHHLAEFSAISWQQVVREMSHQLTVEPKPIQSVPFYAKNIWGDVKNSLQPAIKTALKNLRDGRFSSFYFPRTLVGLFQRGLKKGIQTAPFRPTPYNPDPTFYWILTAKTEFASQTLPGWKPAYSWEDVNKHVFTWMQKAGYTIEKI
jgi:nucleoside-diphosphate-sugar epimerase